MFSRFKELYQFRELLLMIVWRDIKVRYKQTAMGFLWAIFMPMIIVGAGVVVKYAMATVSGKILAVSQLVTVSVKAVPWAFFVAALRFGTNSLIMNSHLVTKIYFPKEIFPISAVLSCCFDFLVASTLLTTVLLFVQIGASLQLLWVPFLIVVMMLMVTGLCLVLSALNLFLRDVKFIVEVILTFAIFFTPVLYEVEVFHQWANLLMVNPMAPLLEGLNACVVLHRAPALGWTAYSAGVAVVLFFAGYAIFKRLESRFAESI